MAQSLTAGGAAEAVAVALKEWASAIRALAEGEQIIVLRKGGIVEETREFRLVSPRFFLLPTYEHQRSELLKPEYRPLVGRTLDEWRPESGVVRLETYAEAAADLEVSDQETLDKLRECHIWTDSFAEERLRWKRKQPLHVLLLRVYRLDLPLELPMRETYAGCKSWVRLEDVVPETAISPVLPDDKFADKVAKIRRIVG